MEFGARTTVRSSWAVRGGRDSGYRSTRSTRVDDVPGAQSGIGGVARGVIAKGGIESVKGSTGRCHSWRERGGTAKTQPQAWA